MDEKAVILNANFDYRAEILASRVGGSIEVRRAHLDKKQRGR